MSPSCPPNGCADCPQRLVCRCLRVTEEALLEALSTHQLRSICEIRTCTGAGDGCTACHTLLARYLEMHAHRTTSARVALTAV